MKFVIEILTVLKRIFLSTCIVFEQYISEDIKKLKKFLWKNSK